MFYFLIFVPVVILVYRNVKNLMSIGRNEEDDEEEEQEENSEK